MKTIAQILCILILFSISACTTIEKKVLFQYNENSICTEIHRKNKDGKWAVYNVSYQKYDSDFIYDSYEPLNIAAIYGSDYIYILIADGMKYLYNARLGEYLLDGEPYNNIVRDNADLPMANGENKVYPMANNRGLPVSVDKYWRIGETTFIYRRGDQYGVFQRESQYDDSKPFISLIAPTTEPLTVMCYSKSDGAECFIIGEGSNRRLIDRKGFDRTMRFNYGDYWSKDHKHWELNSPPYDGAPDEESDPWKHDVTRDFFKLLDTMPIDDKERYYWQFLSNCTRVGNKQFNIIYCNPIELKYKWER